MSIFFATLCVLGGCIIILVLIGAFLDIRDEYLRTARFAHEQRDLERRLRKFLDRMEKLPGMTGE